ncbi:MAG TPA: HNH endonuclease [Gammaproteobacteria bacterium]|nr:HNH endonuclease [Gammaproteobacteria bacterium]
MIDAGSHDTAIRHAAFDWLAEQVQQHDDVLPRSLLAQGFEYQGRRVPLLGPPGIFKPAVLDLPISITTIPDGPYDDGYLSDELIEYRYRGTDPQHRDNRGLREMMRRQVPLVYFYQVVKGKYLALWPAFIVGDDPAHLTFTVQVDDAHRALYPEQHSELSGLHVAEAQDGVRRAYITATVRQRVHQRAFRERVLHAYHEQCAMCRLRHAELLDAAHIIPDGEPDGDPVVPNGLALCKLHHAAFDRNFLGVRPDYTVEVRRDILEESDGPMLVHGLKEMHGRRLVLPRRMAARPREALLERRYARFLEAT